jgi:hypothetical protein
MFVADSKDFLEEDFNIREICVNKKVAVWLSMSRRRKRVQLLILDMLTAGG